jgi:hypothetical protein
MTISFKAKPPPYAICWRVFQRIVEHRPRVRNFVKVRVRNAPTVWGTFKRHFGLIFTRRGRTRQLLSQILLARCYYSVLIHKTIEHRRGIVIDSININKWIDFIGCKVIIFGYTASSKQVITKLTLLLHHAESNST